LTVDNLEIDILTSHHQIVTWGYVMGASRLSFSFSIVSLSSRWNPFDKSVSAVTTDKRVEFTNTGLFALSANKFLSAAIVGLGRIESNCEERIQKLFGRNRV
jgi:hypothetical protein